MKNVFRIKSLSVLIMLSIVFTFMTGCSEKLSPETTPSELATTAQVTETETSATTTSSEEIEPTHGPLSTAVVTDRIVDNNGQLSIDGTNIVNASGEPIQLTGMSTYGLNAIGSFLNADTVQTLVQDWGCDVIRLAMYTEGNSDGYIQDPDKYFEKACEDIDLCIDNGVYVIIDWHILYDGDPNQYKTEAIDFFSRISAIYGNTPNIIYEICNEPNGQHFDDESQAVDWESSIRPYAVDLVSTIRENDPDNIIIVGTANWSQDVDLASLDPIDDDNLMYTVHFYAGSHGQEYRDKVQTAIDNGCAVFCTEWGTTSDTGAGELDLEESDAWLDFFDENNISWCNWSIGGSATESSNALRFISNILTVEEKYQGHWPDEFLSDSGYYVRSRLLGIPYVPLEE